MRPRLLAGLLVIGAVALSSPPQTASALAIQECTITSTKNTLYMTGSETTTTFTFDNSASPASYRDYYIVWWSEKGQAGGSVSLQQAAPLTLARSYLQLLGDTTSLVYTAEPITAYITMSKDNYVSSSTRVCEVSVLMMPNTAPTAVTDVTATQGDGKATVSWTPWRDFAGQTYLVTAAPGGATCTVTHPTTSCDVTGLDNGTSYTFSVKTTTSGGTSSASSPSAAVTPTAPPTPPVTPTTTVAEMTPTTVAAAAPASTIAETTVSTASTISAGAPTSPSISMPKSTAAGSSLTVTASGFASGATVRLTVAALGLRKSLKADSTGRVRATFDVPAGQPAGTITVKVDSGSLTVTKSLTVTSATAAAGGSVVGASTLPATGNALQVTVLAGLLLVIAGAFARRRRPAQ